MAEWINDPQGREEIEKVTKELKLPVWKANHKGKFRDFWNELWDKIEDYILKLKENTEKNSKGLNDRLVSAIGKHDGDFPIANAVVGNVYYSELTKKYYKCKVGGPAPMPNGNFIDMSILENLNRLENLTRKTILLFYNGGSLVPDGTTSIAINENWYFFGLGVGTAVQSGKERMCFLFRTIFQSNNDILRFNGIEIRYNATNKTLKVINNGGNLYFLEQYSSLI
nr:MAG TPA: hypothetical protein [Caudoviricetes sp.]